MDSNCGNKTKLFKATHICTGEDNLIWGYAGKFNNKYYIIFYKSPFTINHDFSKDPKVIADSLNFISKNLMLESLDRFNNLFKIKELKEPVELRMVTLL